MKEKVGEGVLMGWCRESTDIAEVKSHRNPEGWSCCCPHRSWRQGSWTGSLWCLERQVDMQGPEDPGRLPATLSSSQPEGFAVASAKCL